MVYFMGGEAHEQEQPGADVAKAKMAEFMPKPEELKGGKDDKAEVKQENMSMEDGLSKLMIWPELISCIF